MCLAVSSAKLFSTSFKVVASMDRNACCYHADISVQKHRQEIIAEMKEMVKGLLREFYHTNNRRKPERIVFYRDGVSEGQFQEVCLTVCSLTIVKCCVAVCCCSLDTLHVLALHCLITYGVHM